MMTERTLVLIKPDGVQRGLVGEVLGRIERKGYNLVALKKFGAGRKLLQEHYKEHEGKPFYGPLIEFMESGDIVAAVFSGEGVIAGFRSLAGKTHPTEAAPGTIRGDYAREWEGGVQRNIVHGSDSEASAVREVGLWFPDL